MSGTDPFTLSVSVRELAEFAYRSGDLSLGRVSRIRGVEGTRIHQRIQKSRPAHYAAEVRVSRTILEEGLEIKLSGRIDGVIVNDGHLVIEEIKSTRRDLSQSIPELPEHWGQAIIYAFLYADREGFEQAEIQLTYAEVDSLNMQTLHRTMDLPALQAYFDDTIERFLLWARELAHWDKIRNKSISTLAFPFPRMREGQQEMIDAIRSSIQHKHKVFVEAPTGIGKTISALYPAMQCFPKKQVEKIFYLCAKTSGKAIAEKALQDLRNSGLKIKSLTLTAKEKVLCKNNRSCIGPDCPHGRGYYDRVNGALAAMFKEDEWTRERIEAVAQEHRVCTFEFSLDLSYWAEVIICDYNYAFDPRVYLRRFFENHRGRYVFLVDEAHNLVDRSRSMFSAEISRNEFQALQRLLKSDVPFIARHCQGVVKAFDQLGREATTAGDETSLVMRDLPESLIQSLRPFLGIVETWLAANEERPYRDRLRQCWFDAGAFLQTAERFNERFLTLYEKERKRTRVKLYCLDPSELLGKAFQRCRSAALFSATLSPVDYYTTILAREEEDEVMQLPSPFPRENLEIEAAGHIATTYRMRDRSYEAIAQMVHEFSQNPPGNYLVYFPSYAYLKSVLVELRKINPFDNLLVQEPRMSEPARDDFIRAFGSPSTSTRVGLAVMGGVFGEGIDLTGEQLIGAIVVGVGLPQVCLEQNLLRAYYDEQGCNGFDYAYTFPGWTRVLQSAGRVIRTEEDIGKLLLIDQRLTTPTYQELLPPHWGHLSWNMG